MTNLASEIIAVTVFTDRARVTRRGTAQLQAGEQTLTIAALPMTLAPDSVRVAGRGPGMQLLGVDVATDFVTEPPEADLAALTQQLEQLQDQDRALQDDDAIQSAQQEYLKCLGQSGGVEFARGLALGRVAIDGVDGLAQYLAHEQSVVAARRRELSQQRRSLAREIDALRSRLGQIQPPQAQERRAVHVTVAAAEVAELTLELTYMVYGASWSPIYDIRLVDDRVSASYLASVSQQSGEDWPAIKLALSTARPAVTTTIPELVPWYLDIYRPPPMPVARKMAMPAAAMAMAESDMAVGAAPAPAPYAAVVEASVDSSGASVTYGVAYPVAIPADGSPHRANLTTLDLPAKLDYITAPRIAEEAYLRAKVTNASAFVLLPGNASIFHGDEFVGTTWLELVAPNEEFELQLGIDDRIKVERELVGQHVGKTFIGNIRRTQMNYRIKLRNLLGQPAHVTVLDQLPLSRHEDIKVKLDEATPRPSEQDDLNILRWELDMRPGEQIEIAFGFTIEHQRDLQVVGL